MWFATQNGVSRFDGYEFENFTKDDGLPENTVFRMQEDDKGRIWFLSFSGKLAYYENERIKAYQFNHIIGERLRDKMLGKYYFFVDKSDNVYLSSISIEPFKISNSGKAEGLNPAPDSLNYFALEVDSGKYLYCEDRSKDLINDNILSIVKDEKIIETDYEVSRSATSFYYTTTEGNHLIGHRKYLHILSKEGETIYSYEFSNRIIWVSDDAAENIWVGTINNGVFCLDKTSLKSPPIAFLKEASVTCVYQDKEGNHWISTEGKGVYFYPSHHIKNYTRQQSLSGVKANTIAVVNSNVFVGFENGYVDNIKRNSSISSYFMPTDEPFPPGINCLSSHNHTLLIGARGGVYGNHK